MMRVWVVLTLIAASISQLLLPSLGQEQCGWQAGGAVCPGGLCCSQYGYCGTTDLYCGEGCQSNCPSPSPPPPPPPPVTPTPPTPGGDITSIISAELFDRMLLHRSTPPCVGAFYTYDSFVTAARDFPAFGNTGDLETREREVAAFFGQTSQETTGGWPTAPDGNYSWGYCWIKEDTPASCCVADANYPCVPGKTYCGRGPIQLTYNYNYGQAGVALGLNLLNNPELVETDPVVSFKTAIWFWMTPQAPKPSCHEVIIGEWTPTSEDVAAGRLPGYGVITNIINGGVECGKGPVSTVVGRIGFYERYCDFFGIDYGDNLDCFQQRPFGSGFVFASK